jgi:hypothetical protein
MHDAAHHLKSNLYETNSAFKTGYYSIIRTQFIPIGIILIAIIWIKEGIGIALFEKNCAGFGSRIDNLKNNIHQSEWFVKSIEKRLL